MPARRPDISPVPGRGRLEPVGVAGAVLERLTGERIDRATGADL